MKVSLIAVMTLCGRITPGTMGSREDRRFLEEMRAATDAGLLGAGTVRNHDVEMRGPEGKWPAQRIRALVSASGNLPLEGRKIFRDGPRPLVFTSAAAAPALIAAAGERAEIVALPAREGALDLAAACEQLAARGVRSLLVEGGAGLNYRALQQGVVDELLVTIAPKLSGDRHTLSLLDGDRPLGSPFLDLELLGLRQGTSGELFCRYRVAGKKKTGAE